MLILFSKKNLLFTLVLFISIISYGQTTLGITALTDSAELYVQEGNNKKAEKFYSIAKEKMAKEKGINSADYALLCNTIGIFYWNTGNMEEAKKNYETAAIIYDKLKIPGSLNHATILDNLGLLYKEEGDPEKAINAYHYSLTIKNSAPGKNDSTYLALQEMLAELYTKNKQYKQADSLYLNYHASKEKIYGKTSVEYANSYNTLAIFYMETGDFDKSEKHFKEAIAINEKSGRTEHEDYSTIIKNLAQLYTKWNKYHNSLEWYEKAKVIDEKIYGAKNEVYGLTCNAVGLLLAQMGNYAKAEQAYKEAILVLENTTGKETANYATVISNLGDLYRQTGKYKRAEELFILAKNLNEKLFTKESVQYATSCNDLSLVYSEKDDYKQAEPLLLESKNIFEKLKLFDNPNYTTTLANLGEVYRAMGKFDIAENILLETKRVIEKTLGKNNLNYTMLSNNLGNLYRLLGQLEKAEKLYKEAIEITEKVFGKEHPDYAKFSSNLSVTYVELGQLSKAEAISLEALNITFKTLGRLHTNYAAICSDLGDIYRRTGRYKEAEQFLQAARQTWAFTIGKNTMNYPLATNNMGLLFMDMKEYEKALPLFLEANQIWEGLLGKDHLYYAYSANNLGVTYKELKVYDKAQKFLNEAKNSWERISGKINSNYASSVENLAILFDAMGNTSDAEKYFSESLAIKQQQIRKTFGFTSEKDKINYINNAINTLGYYYCFYYNQKDGKKAYDLALYYRNLVLSSAQQLKRGVFKNNNPALKIKYEEWKAAKEKLAFLYTKFVKEQGEEVNKLETIAERLEKELTQLSIEFKTLSNRDEINWKQIQQKLSPDEAAIEFIDFQYHNGKRWTDSIIYVALVLRKDNPEPQMISLFEKRSLDSLLKGGSSNKTLTSLYMRGSMEDNNTVITTKQLYSLVWKPLEEHLKGIQKISFSPTGLLHRIAFAAIPVDSSTTLSDKYILRQFSSTGSIIEHKPVSISTSDDIVVYGGIKYDIDDKSVPTESKPGVKRNESTWNFLPGTEKEIDQIASLAKSARYNVKIFKGTSADEASIKNMNGAASPTVFHIATHGYFFPDPATANESIGLQSNNGFAFRQSNDPLLRSGLLFAGANSTWQGNIPLGKEDGVFTSYEVANMYLPNTNLVVLSACETGLGDIEGNEGVYGLQRAFKLAGVQNLVMSLWKVPDEETAEFMQVFYQNILSNNTIEKAFLQAQNKLKNKYRNDPYKWAAFILVQ